jgi:2-furoyl-CoA dehydrogenase large subunit
MPRIKYGYIETPSPHTYSGAKGMGEGGAAGVHAISAALQDALFEKGIIIEDSHNNADSIFRALEAEPAKRTNVTVERRAAVNDRGRA